MYKKIGIDIDNVLTNLDLTLEIMARYYGKPTPEVDDIIDYNLSSVFGINEAESYNFWSEMEYDLCDGAECNQERLSNFFRLFADSKTEIYIITNRSMNYYDVTKNWLNKNHIPHKELIMTSGQSKVDVLRELDIDLMIDDKPSLFDEVIEAGLRTKMVCVDYPYNQDAKCFMRLDREGRGMVNVY